MIETESGIQIEIKSEENSDSKILIFDKKVKCIELSEKESRKISHLLIQSKQNNLSGEIRKLIYSGYFNTVRTFSEIRKKLGKIIQVKSSSLNVILIKFVERQELTRKGKPRSYLYEKGVKI
jgi:hypothetical protein